MTGSDKEKAVLIITEGKYGLILADARNWVVAELNDGTNSIELNTKDFNAASYTHHANIRQAIINMADRMLKERLKKECANKPLELRELVEIINEKDRWIRKAIMGRTGSGQG